MGEHTSTQFDITNGMLQGSPLSPILSTLYTTQLLKITNTWTHHDLSMYMDDRAIFVTSATTKAATTSTLEGFNVVTAGPEPALVASLVQRVARGDAPEEEES
jgi:hypothetical protein